MPHRKLLFFLCFVVSTFLAITVFYIEFRILIEMQHFEEPSYILPQYNIELKGAKAAIAHVTNITFGLCAIIVACLCYKEFRK